MSSTLIVIIVVLVVVAVALVAGVVLARRRRIDLTGGKPAVEEEARPGGYRAETGISLAPGGPQAPPEPVEVAEPVEAAEPEPEPEPIEEIAPISGRLERLRGRLARSRSTFGQGLLGLLGAGDLDEDSWTEVEDTLLMADLGAGTTTEVVERLRAELVSRGVRTSDQARALLREVLVDALKPDMDRAVRALPDRKSVV